MKNSQNIMKMIADITFHFPCVKLTLHENAVNGKNIMPLIVDDFMDRTLKTSI